MDQVFSSTSPSEHSSKRLKLDASTSSNIVVPPEDVSYRDILKEDYFIDKSMFIEAVIKTTNHELSKFILLTAPRRFGKTKNLQMLKDFFRGSLSRDIFTGLEIGQSAEAMPYYGKYEVVFVNFAWFARSISCYDDAVKACREILHITFKQYPYLQNSDKLGDEDKEICRRWISKIEYKNLDEDDIGKGLLNLSECLCKHHGKKSILMIDEFDAICSRALFEVEETILDKIIRFYSSMIGMALKWDQKYIERAILTGVAHITCTGHSPLNDVKPYKFLDNNTFVSYYGVLENEFNELLEKKCFENLKGKKEEALDYYNGYSYENLKIMNTFSVVHFITSGELKPYWQTSGLVSGLEETIASNSVKRVLHNLLLGDSETVSANAILSANKFSSFCKISRCPNFEFTNTDILLHYLLQQGYLNIVSRNLKNFEVKIPNKELEVEFKEQIQNYYVQICKFDLSLIQECNDHCANVSISDLDSSTSHLRELACCLDKLLKKSVDVSEAWLEHFIFYIFFPNFDVKTQCKVPGRKDRRKDKIFDLLLCRLKDGVYFLLELKINETSQIALSTIVEKKYHLYGDVIKNNYYLIGLNLNTIGNENKTTISYLYNNIDYKNNQISI